MSLLSNYTQLIRRSLVGISQLTDVVGDRIYPAQLADVVRTSDQPPTYPCVNFSIEGVVRDEDFVDHAVVRFRLWVWTQASFQDSHDVYDFIFPVLHRQLLKDANAPLSAVQWEYSGPLQVTDPTAKAYGVVSTWEARITKV